MARMAEPSPRAAAVPFLRVEVRSKPGSPDAAAGKLAGDVRRLLGRPLPVEVVRGYSLGFAPERGAGAGAHASPWIAEFDRSRLHEVLADPVLHDSALLRADDPVPEVRQGWRRIDVTRKPGVMDPTAGSVQRALATVGVPASSVRTYRAFLFGGSPSTEELERIGAGLLANPLIEEVRIDPRESVVPFVDLAPAKFRRVEIPLRKADDRELERISRDGMLALDVAEMRAIREQFAREG